MSSNLKLKRICQYCSKQFMAKQARTQYCGLICARRAYKARERSVLINKSNAETEKLRIKTLETIKTKPFLTAKDVSRLLNLSLRTTYRLLANGTIKSTNISKRKILIKRSDINKLFK